MRFSVDTNILLYALDTDDPTKQSVARDILRRCVDLDMFLTNQVLGEFINVGFRRHRTSIDDIFAIADSWSTLFPIVATKTDHLLTAARIAKRHKLQFWDSVILAITAAQEANVLLTEDLQDGQRIDGVEILNPFKPTNVRRITDVLGG